MHQVPVSEDAVNKVSNCFEILQRMTTSKYKVFNNWESETEGQISYKGCTDIYFFWERTSRKYKKRAWAYQAQCCLVICTSEHLSQQFQFQDEQQFACKLQWGTAVHQTKKSKGGFSPGILGFYEALSGDSISGHREHMETCRHMTTLNKRKMVSLLNSSSLQKKRPCKCSSKISRTKHIQFTGTDSKILSYFHRMYLIMSSQTIKAVRTHAGANILTSCTHA